MKIHGEYNGWHIEKDMKPIPDRRFDYDFWHDDHDGENGLSGNAERIQDSIRQIIDIESELKADRESPVGQA